MTVLTKGILTVKVVGEEGQRAGRRVVFCRPLPCSRLLSRNSDIPRLPFERTSSDEWHKSAEQDRRLLQDKRRALQELRRTVTSRGISGAREERQGEAERSRKKLVQRPGGWARTTAAAIKRIKYSI